MKARNDEMAEPTLSASARRPLQAGVAAVNSLAARAGAIGLLTGGPTSVSRSTIARRSTVVEFLDESVR